MNTKFNAMAAAALLLLTANATAEDGSWKDMFKKAAKEKAAEELNIPSAPANGALSYIISPADGAKISGPVKVVFGLSGMGVAPAGSKVDNTGHHHLLINGPEVDYTRSLPASKQLIHYGGGQTETTLDLAPGKHTLQLLLADWKHQPFNPSVQSKTITIEVVKSSGKK